MAQYYLALFQFSNDTYLDKRLVEAVSDGVRKIESPPEETEIDVWLHTQGGSADAAST